MAPIAADLDLSLGAVGVLGATVFFAGLVAAKLGAAKLTARHGAGRGVQAICLLCLVGNALIAAGPGPESLAAGRFAAGLGMGLTLVLGPVLCREAGGDRLVGLFGASVTIGVAGALGLGSLGREAGIDWRFDFALAAALGLAALLLVPARSAAEIPSGSVRAVFRRAARSLPAWRLELLFTTALGLPYLLGVWLVPFLSAEVGLAAGTAGALGFALFGISAILRPEGGRLDAEGRSLRLLGGVAPLTAAAGLVVIALADGFVVAALGVALAGVGFAIPYAAMYDEAIHLFRGARIASVGVLSVGANVLPLVVAPLVGAAIGAGDGTEALLVLAAVPLAAGLLNLRPAAPRRAPHR